MASLFEPEHHQEAPLCPPYRIVMKVPARYLAGANRWGIVFFIPYGQPQHDQGAGTLCTPEYRFEPKT
jgi:hypothetical protein